MVNLGFYRFNFRVMGGPAELQLYAGSSADAEELFNLVHNDTSAVEMKWSRYRADSILTNINNEAGGKPVQLDEESAGLIAYADHCYHISGGLFDITSGVLRNVWDFKKESVPDQNAIKNVLPLIGWDKVEWEKSTIRLPKKGMEIDFGGVGKEYAVDRSAKILLDNGVKGALINLSGDLFIIGTHIDGTPWSAGIVHPRKAGEVIGTVKMSKGALATSGDYERFFEVDDKRYCHIINPKTGWPVCDFQSVSVQADSCLVAGTAATITMLLGKDNGQMFLRELGVPFISVSSDGTIQTSSCRIYKE